MSATSFLLQRTNKNCCHLLHVLDKLVYKFQIELELGVHNSAAAGFTLPTSRCHSKYSTWMNSWLAEYSCCLRSLQYWHVCFHLNSTECFWCFARTSAAEFSALCLDCSIHRKIIQEQITWTRGSFTEENRSLCGEVKPILANNLLEWRHWRILLQSKGMGSIQSWTLLFSLSYHSLSGK